MGQLNLEYHLLLRPLLLFWIIPPAEVSILPWVRLLLVRPTHVVPVLASCQEVGQLQVPTVNRQCVFHFTAIGRSILTMMVSSLRGKYSVEPRVVFVLGNSVLLVRY